MGVFIDNPPNQSTIIALIIHNTASSSNITTSITVSFPYFMPLGGFSGAGGDDILHKIDQIIVFIHGIVS